MMTDAEFKEKCEEWMVYVKESQKQLAHIENPDLRLLYAAIYQDPEGVMAGGEYILKKATDRLAVLEAIKCAAELIVSDCEEHPENDGEESAKAAIKKCSAEIKTLRGKGQKSDVFAVWKKNRREDDEISVDEMADEFLDSSEDDAKSAALKASLIAAGQKAGKVKTLTLKQAKKAELVFGEDFGDVCNDTYDALRADLDRKQITAIVSAAKAKIDLYKAILPQLSDTIRRQFESQYARGIGRLENNLKKLETKLGAL